MLTKKSQQRKETAAAPQATMAKARISERLKEAAGKKSVNRSEDLDQLTKNFNALQQNQKNLIIALKKHYAAILAMSHSRLQVRNHVELYGEMMLTTGRSD
jgi:hypothetical protein